LFGIFSQLVSSKEEITIEISKLPELKNPKLVCGLPGSGYVGKLALDYMIDKLKATPFANIYSNSFPPQVSIQSDGTVDLVKNSMYYCHTENQDLVLLTGDAQPVSAQGEYALAQEILNICKKLGVSEIYALAAYITGKFSETPKVFGTATLKEIVNEFSKYDVETMERGNITGMNGVIIGMAKQASLSGTCLLGETSGYVVDAKASKAVLEILCKMIKIEFDMSELEKRAKDTEEIIKSIQSQATQDSGGQSAAMSSPTDDKNIGYIS